ncbi:zf-HC2 domain-containing protein [candidate division FCPU426 bacterium]|nr:zf-HC2 domain-containing protein [candidate division FCPU426 bacterium]
MDCKVCRESMYSYLRGYLDREEQRQCNDHLHGCPECRREVEQELRLNDLLDDWDVAGVGRSFAERLLRRPEKKRQRTRGHWLRRLLPIP